MIKKTITRFIGASVAAVCLASSLHIAPVALESDAVSGLTAFEITENMQLGWNLGNTLDSYNGNYQTMGLEAETCWGNPKTTQEMINTVKAKGFNTVRVPVTWFQHVDQGNNFKINDQWLARVKEVVDYCYKNDMYVILNMHHEEGWQNSSTLGSDYERIKPYVTSVWAQLSEAFKDYDQHLVFETMNEPRATGTDHEWYGPQQSEVDTINKLNADILAVIRKSGGNNTERLVMMPGYCASSNAGMMAQIVVPDDDMVAVSVHAYEPYDFCMNSKVQNHDTFTEQYRAGLNSIIDGIRRTFLDKDIPVVLGEFSASNFNNTEARCQWADAYISITKAYGIPCVLWDNNAYSNSDGGEAHGYLNRASLSWYDGSSQVIDTMVKVLKDDSIVWGSEGRSPVYNHEDITKGNILTDKKEEIDASVTNGNCSSSVDFTAKALGEGDVAVKFTGEAPVIALMNGNWKGWTEIKPYDIDEEKGIAYYSSKHINQSWADESDYAHLCTRTNGKTTIEMIAIIGGADIGDIDVPEDKTKKYVIDFSQRSGSDKIAFVVEGKAGSSIGGCVGYDNAGDWEKIEWEDTIPADGKLIVEADFSKVPLAVEYGEFQIWWCDDDDAEMTSYAFQLTGNTGEQKIAYGDANEDGEVGIADATIILQHIGNPDGYPLSAQGELNADVCAPKGLTAQDSYVIQMVDAGMLKVADLPVESA